MFAVLLGHVVSNNGVLSTAAFQWHIPGFLFITGYFGTRFRISKVVSLLTTCYLCYWLTIPFRPLPPHVVDLILPHGGWFLPFYLVLLLMSPLLNAVVADRSSHRTICFYLSALVIVSWFPLFVSGKHAVMLYVPGMQGNGLMLMVATYLFGRIMYGRITVYGRRSVFWVGISLFVVLNALSVWLYGAFPLTKTYLSPLALASAMCGFVAFKNLRCPETLGRVICFISPSMFGVYLLHECCVRHWQYSGFAQKSPWHAIIWAVGLFVACVCIDLVRRLIMCVLSKLHESLSHSSN